MVKLVLTIILFLISLLTVLSAPAFYLWLLAIATDEFPWIFIAIILVIVFINFRSPSYQLPTMILAVISLLLFLSPMVRSYLVGSKLQKNLAAAFGNEIGTNAFEFTPFSYVQMFKPKVTVPYSTVSYDKNGKTDLTLDFYPSEIKGKKPCVIIIHGGSWKSGDSQQLPELNSYLAKNGYHVAAINYRLAPEFQSPAPVEDISKTFHFLKGKSAEWNIDTTNFILLGRSAGAQIALLAGYTLKEPALKGIIDLYGPADMVWGYSIPSNPLIMDSRKVMEDYLGGSYSGHPEKFEKSSPLLFVNKQSPPTLLIHGLNDVLVAYEHSRRLNAKLEENGVKHYLVTLPWATHAFDYNLYGPGGQISTYAIMYFLKSVTE
ncbi:alpha/beta hydrolase fold domain-containing protein [Dyadobacter subterraneus]|uniref:Alpha/beta hydrolase n=1 Tax=Dyadobacter subterraneus TaxID=2773304 RepID=A0ABR9WBU7_9BACT|nr:alpha/beta hydrolase [Dyadobacter subterraneus]MBE9462956.1 alpha/beta hydrolase [Dyadobacter subterraneus]